MKITTLDDFLAVLAVALQKIRPLVEAYSEEWMVRSIDTQLHYLETWAQAGANWGDERLRKLNLGLLASKVVDAEDRDLADAIYALANYVDDNLHDAAH